MAFVTRSSFLGTSSTKHSGQRKSEKMISAKVEVKDYNHIKTYHRYNYYD